jgi:hypothetical protein
MLEGNRLAIVIGIDNYFDHDIAQLKGARNDAKELCEMLRNPEIGNFIVRELIGEEARCARVREVINDALLNHEVHYNLVLLYFSGHGFVDNSGQVFVDNKEGYIAPYDMIKAKPFVNGIKMRELTDIISNSINKDSVVTILDCCYSGIATAKGNNERIEISLDVQGQGRIALASSEADDESRERSGCKHFDEDKEHPHGAFTSYLIDGMAGRAADKDGVINIEALYKYAETQMTSSGKGKPTFSVQKGSQIPEIKIAIAPEKYKLRITEQITEVKKDIEVKTIEGFLKAARELGELESLEQANPALGDLKKKINDGMREINKDENTDDKIQTWLSVHRMGTKILMDKDPSLRGLYSNFFNNYNSYLSYDGLSTINDLYSCLLSALFEEFEAENEDEPRFVNKCKGCVRNQGTSKAATRISTVSGISTVRGTSNVSRRSSVSDTSNLTRTSVVGSEST